MPLHHDIGERIEGLDEVFLVAPFAKYAEQTRLTAIVEETVGTKFKRKVKRERRIVDLAMAYAANGFAKMGLPQNSDIDILVQEYPRVNQVAFLFCARMGGKDYYIAPPAVFQLGDAQIADLTLRGLWQPYKLN
jgi:hypothetical protein